MALGTATKIIPSIQILGLPLRSWTPAVWAVWRGERINVHAGAVSAAVREGAIALVRGGRIRDCVLLCGSWLLGRRRALRDARWWRRAHASQQGYEYGTEAARDFCHLWPEYCKFFRNDAFKAQKYARRLFTQPEAESDGTKTNTFKHAFWVAMMIHSITSSSLLDDDKYYLADEFAYAHEENTRNGSLSDKRETAIDDQNNEVGYNFAVANSPDRRGSKHNTTFFCNGIRNRIKRGRRARFNTGTPAIRPPIRSWQLMWRRTVHKDTHEVVRLFRKDEFSNGEPCIFPS